MAILRGAGWAGAVVVCGVLSSCATSRYENTMHPDYGGGGERGVGCKVEDGELGIDVNGLPHGALELEHGSRIRPIVAGDGYRLDHGPTVAGAIEGDGDGAGLTGFHLLGPVSGDATARLHAG